MNIISTAGIQHVCQVPWTPLLLGLADSAM